MQPVMFSAHSDASSGDVSGAAGAWAQIIGTRWQDCYRLALLTFCFEGEHQRTRKVSWNVRIRTAVVASASSPIGAAGSTSGDTVQRNVGTISAL